MEGRVVQGAVNNFGNARLCRAAKAQALDSERLGLAVPQQRRFNVFTGWEPGGKHTTGVSRKRALNTCIAQGVTIVPCQGRHGTSGTGWGAQSASGSLPKRGRR